VRAGVLVGTVRQLEQGRSEPMFETAAKLAAGLGVAVSAFETK
jgi:transcriptional regulator with XRE-family HTH domain